MSKFRTAKCSVASLGLVDRLRVLLTGRVIVYVFNAKPNAEVQVASRLPRGPEEARQVLGAIKAARDARRAAAGKVVASGRPDVSTQGETPRPDRRNDRGRGPLEASRGGSGSVPVQGLPPVAHGTPLEGNGDVELGRYSSGRGLSRAWFCSLGTAIASHPYRACRPGCQETAGTITEARYGREVARG
jgi:hypothetical protein